MAHQTVTVSFSTANGGTLGVDHAAITLNDPTDTVSWIASSETPFPSGSALLIQFDEPFGPFQAIRSVNPSNLLAKGNTANVQTFTYFLSLVTGLESDLIKAGPFTVDNQCTAINTSPWVKIEVEQISGVWNLIPQHQPLSLHQGDDGILEVTGPLPQDFVFAFFYPTGSPNQGPFSTFFTTRQNGTGNLRMYVATFESDVVASLNYQIRLWDGDGQLVASEDPSIDGLGRPPGT